MLLSVQRDAGVWITVEGHTEVHQTEEMWTLDMHCSWTMRIQVSEHSGERRNAPAWGCVMVGLGGCMLSDHSGGAQRNGPEDVDMLWLYLEGDTSWSTVDKDTEMHQDAEMC